MNHLLNHMMYTHHYYFNMLYMDIDIINNLIRYLNNNHNHIDKN